MSLNNTQNNFEQNDTSSYRNTEIQNQQQQNDRNSNNHQHGKNQACQECFNIAGSYSSMLYDDKSLNGDSFTSPILPLGIDMDGNDQRSEIQKIQYFLTNYAKCVFCMLFGYLTFGFFKHLTTFRYYPRYLTFMISFSVIFYDFFFVGEKETDHKITGLVFFLMFFSILLRALMLHSRKVINNILLLLYKFCGNQILMLLNRSTGMKSQIEGQKASFSTMQTAFQKIRTTVDKNEFLDFLTANYSQEIYTGAMGQSKVGQTRVGLRIFETIVFNAAIIGCLFIHHDKRPMTYVQIILFQIYFSFNILYHTNEQILGIMRQKLRLISKVSDTFQEKNADIDIEFRNMEQDFKNLINKHTIKVKLATNIQRQMTLNFHTFSYSRDVASSTCTVYIVVVFLMGFFMGLDNFNFTHFQFKRDLLFMLVFVTYMIFLSINVVWLLIKKNQINSEYKEIVDEMTKKIMRPIEEDLQYNTEQIHIKELDANEEEMKIKNESNVRVKAQHQQMLGQIQDQIGRFNAKRDEILRVYSMSIHQKASIMDKIKDNCERLIYIAKVRTKILMKFMGIFFTLIFASVISQ